MKKLLLLNIFIAGCIFCQQPMKLLPVTTEVKPYLQLYRVSDSYKLCTPETVPATIEAGIKYAGQKEGQAVSFPSVSINVEITNPNNSIVSTVVTNNTGGNVSIPFTGSAIGRYSITATINSSTYPEFSIYTQTFCVMIANDIDGDGDPDPDSSTDGDEDSEGELLVNLTIENDLTECMEGRELTFTAVISRDININKDDYYWSYVCTLPDGTEYTTSVGPVTDRTLTYDITMDNLLDGDTDHFYPAYSYVILESNTAKGIIESNKRNFKVFELFIKRIWDTEPNGIENDWKVVLGEDFWYEVIAPNNQSALEEMTWNWEFLQGATKKWSLESTMEDGNFSYFGTAKIPYSDLDISQYGEPQNSWFGDANGMIKVSCTDYDGNPYEQTSTDPNIDKIVKVFFNPIFGVGGNDVYCLPEIPLWYYCYKSIIPELNQFNFNLTDWTLPGSEEGGDLYIGHRAFEPTTYSYDLTVYDLSLELPQNFTISANYTDPLTTLTKVLIHELYHKDVYLSWNSISNPDQDHIPDDEETSPGHMNWPGSNEFAPTYYGYPDTYKLSSINKDFAIYFEYGDQELRCRQIQNLRDLDIDESNDWSKREFNLNW